MKYYTGENENTASGRDSSVEQPSQITQRSYKSKAKVKISPFEPVSGNDSQNENILPTPFSSLNFTSKKENREISKQTKKQVA